MQAEPLARCGSHQLSFDRLAWAPRVCPHCVPAPGAVARIMVVPGLLAMATLLAGAAGPLLAIDADIDQFVQAEMALNGIPGLSLAVVEGGAASQLRAYGVRSVTSREAMRVDTPVELASVSKSLTALAVLQLEREGRLDRDDSVTALLPEMGHGKWRGVTIRDLLRHRSGLRRRHDFLISCCGLPGNLDLESVAGRMAEADLESPPGAMFSYANSNYALLAAVVQRASGAPFPEYMKHTVFEPLGMHRTTVDEAEAREQEMADRHEWRWGRVEVSPSRFLGWYGSSRVKASATDMSSYMTALLDPLSRHASAPIPRSDWWEQLEPDYDLGWSVQAEAGWLDGEFVLEHTGKIWGGHTAVALAPRRHAGVAVLVNLGTDRASRIARAILASRFGAPLPQPARMSRTEDPDFWARVFLVSAAGLFAAIFWYGARVFRQVRRRIRSGQVAPWGIARAAVLVGLAATLIHSAAWSTPPHAALPTTIGIALPVLVAGVTAMLLLAAATGLFPRSTSRRSQK